jgi:tetratricopeptide (TPR) repeat protein
MTGKSQSCKSIIIALAVIFLLTGCNSRENLDHRDLDKDYKPYPGNISNKDVNKFLSSVRKVDGASEAKYRMARHFQKRNRHKVALIELKEIIQIDPTFVKAYNAMGVSYEAQGDFKKAIRSYKLALKIDPNLDYVYNNLGFAHLLSDNYDFAIDAFQKAITLNDQSKRFHNNLGLAYAKKGQFDLAIEQFRLTGDEFSANYKLGQILYREGNYEMAFQYNEKAHHAKASAQIMSSVSSSDKDKGPDVVLEVEDKSPKSKSSAVSSNSGQTHLKPEEKTSVYTMSGLTQIAKDNEVPADESSRTSPLIIRKPIMTDSGFTEQHFKEAARKTKSDLPDKKTDLAQTNHPELSKGQSTSMRRKEDLEQVSKNEVARDRDFIVAVEIEISNGNGVNGMASRVANYLRKKGFKVSRLNNASSFNHATTKIFYYNGHLQDVHRLLQEIPAQLDAKNIIELQRLGNRIKILIGKDMIPYDGVISKAYSAKHPS